MGVCSGLVLGFLAAIVAVHFVSNRRSGVPFSPKASGPFGTSAYHSPPGVYQGELWVLIYPFSGRQPTDLAVLTFLAAMRCSITWTQACSVR